MSEGAHTSSRHDDGAVLLGEREIPAGELFAAVLGRVRRECAQILGAAGAADMSLVWASLLLALFGLGGVTPAIMAVAEGLGPGVSR